jgi:hypothetical protein
MVTGRFALALALAFHLAVPASRLRKVAHQSGLNRFPGMTPTAKCDPVSQHPILRASHAAGEKCIEAFRDADGSPSCQNYARGGRLLGDVTGRPPGFRHRKILPRPFAVLDP